MATATAASAATAKASWAARTSTRSCSGCCQRPPGTSRSSSRKSCRIGAAVLTTAAAGVLVRGLLLAPGGAALLHSALAAVPHLQTAAVLELVGIAAAAQQGQQADSGNNDGGGGKAAVRLSPSPPSSAAQVSKAAADALRRLCGAEPTLARVARDGLTSVLALPETTAWLTAAVLQDGLDWLSSLAFGGAGYAGASLPAVAWPFSVDFAARASAMVSAGPSPGRDRLTSKAGQVLREALLADAREALAAAGWTAASRAHAHLRLFCALVRIGQLAPSCEELDLWLSALAGKVPRLQPLSTAAAAAAATVADVTPSKPPPAVALDGRTIQHGLAFTCLVPGLAGGPFKAQFRAAVAHLLSPALATPGTTKEAAGTHQEALWIAVQLYLKRYADIAARVRAAMGITLAVHNESLRDVADAAGHLDGTVLAAAVAALRLRLDDAAASPASNEALDLALLALQSPPFVRHAPDMAGLVLSCLQTAQPPYSQVLITLMRTFGESRGQPLPPRLAVQQLLEAACRHLYQSSGGGDNGGNAIASEEAVCEIGRAALAAVVLLTREQAARDDGELQADDGSDAALVLEGVPWRHLAAGLHRHLDRFELLLPLFQGLALAVVPEHLGPIADLAAAMDSPWLAWQPSLPRCPVDCWLVLPSAQEAAAMAAESRHQPLMGLRVLAAMQHSYAQGDANGDMSQHGKPSADCQLACTDDDAWRVEAAALRGLVPVLLEPGCARSLHAAAEAWWAALPLAAKPCLRRVLAEVLSCASGGLATLDANGPKPGRKADRKSLELLLAPWERDIALRLAEPLALLRCDPRSFRSRAVLTMLLEQLGLAQAAQRRVCHLAMAVAAPLDAAPLKEAAHLRREELACALLAHESAVCQLLLEACESYDELGDGDSGQARQLQECRRLLCGHVSLLLRESPLLLKLLHYQGYSLELVYMLVAEVPAMAAQGVAIASELLRQTSLRRQLLAVVLVSELAQRWPNLPGLSIAAGQVVEHVEAVCRRSAGAADFLAEALMPAARLGVAFSPLAPSVLAILQACLQASAPLARSGPPQDAPLHAAVLAAFRCLMPVFMPLP
eukprot:SM000096S24908  [mRNA]  locus=s96:404847:410195:- [translate_table: standard]